MPPTENKQIYTIDVISQLRYVFANVDEKFTELLKKKITTSYKSLDNYNLLFFKKERAAFRWAFRSKNGHNLQRLIKICDTLSIPYEYLRKQIIGFYSYGSHNKPVKLPEHIRINESFVEGYALYIAEGDTGDSGTQRPRKLRLTNSEPDVINFFIIWLCSHVPGIPFYINAVIPSKSRYENNIDKLKIEKEKVTFSRGDYNKKIKYRICMDNAIIIIDLMLAIRTEVKKIVSIDKKLSCAYLRGLMAGEGTVYNNRSKYVRLEMKNHGEIAFAKRLFKNLDITFTFHKRSNRDGMESIYIGGKDNLKKYHELVGFGAHKKRQDKLTELIVSYDAMITIAEKEKQREIK